MDELSCLLKSNNELKQNQSFLDYWQAAILLCSPLPAPFTLIPITPWVMHLLSYTVELWVVHFCLSECCC